MDAFKRRVRHIFLFHERDKRAETESLSLSLSLYASGKGEEEEMFELMERPAVHRQLVDQKLVSETNAMRWRSRSSEDVGQCRIERIERDALPAHAGCPSGWRECWRKRDSRSLSFYYIAIDVLAESNEGRHPASFTASLLGLVSRRPRGV